MLRLKIFLMMNTKDMQNKLDILLAEERRPLLMAHFIAGYPTVPDSTAVAEGLIAGGADIVELQIPFSDPLADGPTIMAASQEALTHGARIVDAFDVARKLQVYETVPVMLMCYANTIFQYGIQQFVESAKDVGISGLIVPDMPFDSEEGKMLLQETKRCGVHLILVVSPGVSRDRLEALAPYTSGFVYCTSRQGITGADSKFATDLTHYIETMKEIFKMPVGLGFGIKTHKDFSEAATLADIVIAGSVFVEVVQKVGVAGVAASVRSLRGGVGDSA